MTEKNFNGEAKMKKSHILFLILTGFYIVNVRAQQGTQETLDIGKRWSVSFVGGTSKGGPARDLEEAMVANGFGQTDPGGCFFFCTKEKEFPDSVPGLYFSANIKYRVNNLYALSLYYSKNDFGETAGYNNRVRRLYISNTLKSISPIISVGVQDLFALGVGPALHFVEAVGGRPKTAYSETKLGAIADLTFKIPRKSTFYFTLNLQYKIVGNVSVGPFRKEHFGEAATFNRVKVNYNQLAKGFGWGFRF